MSLDKEVKPSNPNTKVRVIRDDYLLEVVDLDVVIDRASDGRKERGETWEKLGAWAKSQIESWPGDDKIKNQNLLKLERRHPADTVPFMIIQEPVLMLSNLSIEQLGKIEKLLWLCTENTTGLDNSAFQAGLVVGGVRLGREFERVQKVGIIKPGD